ncbi:MAG: type II secretion system F family protein [Planctomycetota bacterium]
MASICLLAGIAAASLAWTFRHGVERRLDRDVAWLDEVRLRFDPVVSDSRKYVMIFYFVHGAVILPLLHFLIPVPGLGIVLWFALWLLPQKIADRKWVKRLGVIDEQLPAAIRKFAALTGAGMSSADAMRQLSQEAPLPIQVEFRVMAREWDMGADLNAVVEATAHRLDMQSFRLFASVVCMNNRLGGDLVKALEALSASLGGLMEMRREVRAATAEGRANVYGLLAAPPLMLFIIAFIDGEAVSMFLSTPLGWSMLAPALGLTAIGFFWARRIAAIEV